MAAIRTCNWHTRPENTCIYAFNHDPPSPWRHPLPAVRAQLEETRGNERPDSVLGEDGKAKSWDKIKFAGRLAERMPTASAPWRGQWSQGKASSHAEGRAAQFCRAPRGPVGPEGPRQAARPKDLPTGLVKQGHACKRAKSLLSCQPTANLPQAYGRLGATDTRGHRHERLEQGPAPLGSPSKRTSSKTTTHPQPPCPWWPLRA